MRFSVLGRKAAGRFARIADLCAHLARTPPRPADPLVANLIRLIEQHGATPLHELTRTIDISERQLRRRFSRAVGYGIKTFQRITRLQRLRALAVSPLRPALRLSRLAYELGYADQAHMTREIGALAGISPAALLRLAPRLQTSSDPFSA